MDQALVLARTQNWVSRFVVGHNICPFAGTPLRDERIRFVVSQASEPEALLAELWQEAIYILDRSPEEVETSLLIHPLVLTDFEEYLDFLGAAELLLEEREWEEELQIASFHPDYLFEGVAEDDNSHFSNRSPYPMLHLLRQDSVSWAVDHHPDVEAIPERNIAYLQGQARSEILRNWEAYRTFAPDDAL